MPTANIFQPNWASPPGETIADLLRRQQISTHEFARRIGLSTSEADALLGGSRRLDGSLAQRLHVVLGGSIEFWTRRELQYRVDSARLSGRSVTQEEHKWLDELPLESMVRLDWMETGRSTTDWLQTCLSFFDVPSVAAWRVKYDKSLSSTVYRTSPSFGSRRGSLASWLRRGEQLATQMDCQAWNEHRFTATLPDIKRLTRRANPVRFISELVDLCSSCGVAIQVVRAPAGCRASGATFFASPSRAVVLLSFRHLSDDHFWFTFFHEAGHLLLHGPTEVFVEGLTAQQTDQEAEANAFAEQILLPAPLRDEISDIPLTPKNVIRFAGRAGVSPGIIVGQLQHHGLVPRDQLNSLKRRYRWTEKKTLS